MFTELFELHAPSIVVADTPTSIEPAHALRHACDQLRRLLNDVFAGSFALVDAQSGELLPGEQPSYWADSSVIGLMCQQAALHRLPVFIAEEPPLAILAIPLVLAVDTPKNVVAIRGFLLDAPDVRTHDAAAKLFGWNGEHASQWLASEFPAPADVLLRRAAAVQKAQRDHIAASRLSHENHELSGQISAKYEEVSLLYALTQNLKLSSGSERLGRQALVWLGEVVPAEALVLQLLPIDDRSPQNPAVRTTSVWLTEGQCPLNEVEFSQLLAHLSPDAFGRPLVLNGALAAMMPEFAGVLKQFILVPLVEGEHVFGWLAAINHRNDREFGSEEAQLLGSVASILGIHAGNLELYRQQAELLDGVIRALTSAIDAKDQYTCGHSDRVARVAVRLGQELGLPPEFLKTIYLSGLLHDIGKIGIDDHVLRKPDRLTPGEFEHIKTHVEIGYNILVDVKQLAHLLPGVRHHHESWDGRGYPHSLAGEGIPLVARIIAVADSFDAMGSDRPYRKGMDEIKLDTILRDGAGRQWDPRVVAAYFAAREDIRDIALCQKQHIDPDVPIWAHRVIDSPGDDQPLPRH